MTAHAITIAVALGAAAAPAPRAACVSDAGCGEPTSGQVCVSSSCTAGCSLALGRNTCPTYQSCSDSTGAVGTCVNRACRTSADCGGSMVCDPTALQCLECDVDAQTGCETSPSGRHCGVGGLCGCLVDGDCAGEMGVVCDASRARCTPGCRGVGGASCPTGTTCTSTTAAAGQCLADQVYGGGAVGCSVGGAPGVGGAPLWLGLYWFRRRRARG